MCTAPATGEAGRRCRTTPRPEHTARHLDQLWDHVEIADFRREFGDVAFAVELEVATGTKARGNAVHFSESAARAFGNVALFLLDSMVGAACIS